MKKLLYFAVALMLATSVSTAQSDAKVAIKSSGEPSWLKSTTNVWEGVRNTWYKLNASDASLLTSTDNKTWTASKDGMWQDKDGKWLKIVS